MLNTKYGFSVGQIVTNPFPVVDEDGAIIKSNSELRIVAIAQKVRRTSQIAISMHPEAYDSKEYFLNLVRAEQEKDWGNRIRVNFVCVQK